MSLNSVDIYPCRVFVTMMDNGKAAFSICINDREIWKEVCKRTQIDTVTTRDFTEQLEHGLEMHNIVKILSGIEVNLLFSEVASKEEKG